MASSTSSSPQPKPGTVAVGLTILIVVVLIAAVIGISFLPNPYYAIGQVIIYAGLVALIAARLRTCLRLAQGTACLSKLHGIIFWVVLGVFSVVAHLGDLFNTDNRDYINLATNVAVYLALLYSLELIEQFLKRGAADANSAGAGRSAEASTSPSPPLQQSGPA